MDIVSNHQWNTRFPAHPNESGIYRRLVGQPVILQFKVEIALPEDIFILHCHFTGTVKLPVYNGRGNFTAQAGAQGNNPFTVFPHGLFVRPWFIVKTPNVSL